MDSDKAQYHIFLSYPHLDDRYQQWVTKLVRMMETVFRSLTGQSLQIFIDMRSITTAQLWEERIRHALENSHIMVALLSPSYFTSEWCVREWDYFVTLEKEKRRLSGPDFDPL